MRKLFFPKKRRYSVILFYGFLIGVVFIILSAKVMDYTSTDEFCMSCHVHPHAEENWRLSTHYDNKSGIVVHCVECHLPPPGNFDHFSAKAVTGLRDVYGMVFKDTDKINWEAKRQLSAAIKHTYEESCISCHQNLFPLQLSEEGMHAHLHYDNNRDELNCLNCHLHVGHFSEHAQQTIDFGLEKIVDIEAEIYTEPSAILAFERFTETVPGTSVAFDMLPIPGGQFTIGSPENEPGRRNNEGPQRTVEVSPFFMSEIQVSWDMYMAFFRETMSEGRVDQGAFIVSSDSDALVDGISGPTPPWGSPDQGWGYGDRPAITMTWHAANVFCEWLSLKTGKNYRLPTEAEWEFAARGGTETPYFFEGNPKEFTRERFINRLLGPDTTTINTYVVYEENSMARTQTPDVVNRNPFGLKNMLGNVWEFCSDYYDENVYAMYPAEVVIINPQGPPAGNEKVIRGGSFRSDAYEVRSASRSHTRHDEWLITDPQIPKSIWWYSDVFDVGFRVVLEWPGEETENN
jgi:formylglycine-generating enzyme required for sulfatase activity